MEISGQGTSTVPFLPKLREDADYNRMVTSHDLKISNVGVHDI